MEESRIDKVPRVDEALAATLAEVDERLQVETIAQLVEQLDTNGRLESSMRNLWQSISNQGLGIGAVQGEIRDLIMDVALLKRAVSSAGQVGVMERQRIEKELILELFPPRLLRPGTGVAVASPPEAETKVDCENRLPLCKAACCRIFNALLTAEEVESARYDWNPRLPYSLRKNRLGCLHLRSTNWSCSNYDCRPATCMAYSCQRDSRIWADFEKKIVNPDLRRELDKLDGGPGASQAESIALGQVVQSEQRPAVNPPDFFELRKMKVPEPNRKFVLPPAIESQSGPTTVANGEGQPAP